MNENPDWSKISKFAVSSYSSIFKLHFCHNDFLGHIHKNLNQHFLVVEDFQLKLAPFFRPALASWLGKIAQNWKKCGNLYDFTNTFNRNNSLDFSLKVLITPFQLLKIIEQKPVLTCNFWRTHLAEIVISHDFPPYASFFFAITLGLGFFPKAYMDICLKKVSSWINSCWKPISPKPLKIAVFIFVPLKLHSI